MNRLAARFALYDPGLVRSRRGARAACATVLAWATMVAVTSLFDVTEPLRITLFAAGAAFEGALLAPDPQPRDRLRTLGWAAVVSTCALLLAMQLSGFGSWAVAVLLIALMFLSYALRLWSTRVAGLALMGAITVYVTGAGYITVGRIGWFVLALLVGYAWIALWESIILRDDPMTALQTSVDELSVRAADTVGATVHSLNTSRDGTPPGHAQRALRKHLARVRSCRAAIDTQVPGAVLRGLRPADADQVTVSVYATEKALQDLVEVADEPQWMRALPDEVAWSITNALNALSVALRTDDAPPPSRLAVDTTAVPRDVLLTVSIVLDAGELVAHSLSRARRAVHTAPVTEAEATPPPVVAESSGLNPAIALAIQSVVAAVSAALVARVLGNDQGLVVAWTAFVVVAATAGTSKRRARGRVAATLLGAVGGVVIAAVIPGSLFWTVAAVMVGVFFTIVTAPVSYPATVFWLNIALVSMYATEGLYLDLVWDKTMAALIGGAVATVVTLSVVPIRSSRTIGPTVRNYLDALDESLSAHVGGEPQAILQTLVALDHAHAAVTAAAESASAEARLFGQFGTSDDVAERVDAVHAAYLRLTPLLSEASRDLHDWTDERVLAGVTELSQAVTAAREGRRLDEFHWPASDHDVAQMSGTRRVRELHQAIVALVVSG